MHVRMYACMYLCICVFVYLCICVFVYLCICVFVYFLYSCKTNQFQFKRNPFESSVGWGKKSSHTYIVHRTLCICVTRVTRVTRVMRVARITRVTQVMQVM